MMNSEFENGVMKVAAIIVTYNGGREITETFNSIFKQVDVVIIIDNCSTEETQLHLHLLERNEKTKVIRLDDNYGIAKALNIGINVAKEEQANWVLTLDQDSICSESMIKNMLECSKLPNMNTLGFYCPIIDYKHTLREVDLQSGITYVKGAISSGCLYPVETLLDAGPQCDEYFIDSVDFEYCLRLRSMGYRLIQVNNALLKHNLGTTRRMELLGMSIRLSIHSPLRRYYIFRNHIFLVRRYWRYSPIFLIKKTVFMCLLLTQILLLEKDKISNIRQCFSGFIDGIYKRSGKFVG